jgi:hypothetical protein
MGLISKKGKLPPYEPQNGGGETNQLLEQCHTNLVWCVERDVSLRRQTFLPTVTYWRDLIACRRSAVTPGRGRSADLCRAPDEDRTRERLTEGVCLPVFVFYRDHAIQSAHLLDLEHPARHRPNTLEEDQRRGFLMSHPEDADTPSARRRERERRVRLERAVRRDGVTMGVVGDVHPKVEDLPSCTSVPC